jgi:acetyl-CoA carboxylase/biotin carboxylase 1
VGQVIDVPGGSNNHNYANVKLIVQIAVTCLADAVWAGWGHASENPQVCSLALCVAVLAQWAPPPPPSRLPILTRAAQNQ